MEKDSILIIDDEEGIRVLLRLSLEMHGYKAVCSANGAEALELLSNGFRPYLILLDLMMPVMNGWKFADAIYQSPELSQIPIVVISAFPERAQEVKNVSDILEKPIDIPTLLAIARKHNARKT